ncbi:D-ribose pyranase [Gudongella sp. DL1XJH-153]|uniref:D-ribose pyranase n=1 Tax=Gudongella sp. DL1XJH-153 TaxID=3409804 RepID=UPI003BB54661
MKKNFLLNSDISSVISRMGHMDELTIGDAGLPIPSETPRIDLAVFEGVPSFLDVLRAVLSEHKIEGIILAEEIKYTSPEMHAKIRKLVEEFEDEFSIAYIPHLEFKNRTKTSKAVVRTGEFTPYANIILISGVIF